MKITKQSLLQISLISILMLSHFVAEAHHSHANLNRDDIRTYSGVVVRYSWTMPHVFLKVRAPNKAGKVVEYSIEMQHPPAMAKRGWTKKSFMKGDSITWEGPHDYNESRHYTGLSWAERQDGSRLSMTEKEEGVVVPSTDFSGLWKRSDFDPQTGKAKFNPHYKPPKNWPLTELGQEQVDNFHEDQNPMVNCGNPGPPKAMIVPYPVMITRPNDKTIIFERELMRDVRVIHLDQSVEKKAPSKLGHSIAWFVDESLIVSTDNFVDDPWGSHTGINSSSQKRLTEKFTLSGNGTYLIAEITIDDPVFLTEPHTFFHRWKKIGDREVIQAPCTMESAKLYLQGG
jgi:hypothetical protein